MTSEFTVSGRRESSGNEFEAPVTAEKGAEQAFMKFKGQVNDPADFQIENVEKRL